MDLPYAKYVLAATTGCPDDVDWLLSLFPRNIVCTGPSTTKRTRVNHLVSVFRLYDRVPGSSICGASYCPDSLPHETGSLCRQCCRQLHVTVGRIWMSEMFWHYVNTGYDPRARQDLDSVDWDSLTPRWRRETNA